METNEIYAQNIYNIVKGYRNEEGIFITQDSILEWAAQFGDDSNFMLMETAHLMPQIYFSKERVEKYLKDVINYHKEENGYQDWESFLKDAHLLNLQPAGKSQSVLLELLNDMVIKRIGHCLSEYDQYSKKHYIYIDDILATGKTIGDDLCKWLKEDNRADSLAKNEISLQIAVICCHTLGWGLQQFRLQKTFGDSVVNKIKIWRYFEIENNLRSYKPKLNIAIPIKDYVSHDVMKYFDNLEASKNEHNAFRQKGTPSVESFFSSPEDRIKYENILLDKGLYIINQATKVNSNIRPLGIINPYHKMLGLGTHFVTWRNIPNNCPLVFWWDVPAHNWKPLFKSNRT